MAPIFKQASIFFLKVISLYLVFTFIFTSIGKEPYRQFFRSTASFFLADFSDKGVTQFKEYQDEEGKIDTQILLMNKEQFEASSKSGGPKLMAAGIGIDSWIYGAMPTLFLISLILASPISFRRKAVATLGGLTLFHSFILLKLWLRITYEYQQYPALKVASTDPFYHGLTTHFYNISILIGSSIMVTVFLWLLLAFPSNLLLKPFERVGE